MREKNRKGGRSALKLDGTFILSALLPPSPSLSISLTNRRGRERTGMSGRESGAGKKGKGGQRERMGERNDRRASVK